MSTTASGGCPECEGTLRTNGGETVCGTCGLVVAEDRLDRGPEWRSFDGEADPSRTGAPLTHSRHDRGLSTEIGRTTRVKGRKRRQWARMRRQHTRARISTKRDRNQVYAFTEIRRLAAVLSVPNGVRDRACALFRSAQGANLLRGRSLEGFAAAAVYVACRTSNLARTRSEVVASAKADANELAAAFDAMNRELGLPVEPTDAAELLPRFASKLDLDSATERRAREFVDGAKRDGHASGRNPAGVAAGCLYAAARETGADLTQHEAADVADVTPVTVRKTYVAVRDGE
jgi:transcription initiation factor TFIIB